MNACRTARALLVAFEAQLGPLAEIDARTRSWSSATFAGTRHTLSFVVGPRADIEGFRRDLGEIDYPLPRAFVADIAVASVAPVETQRRVVIEALVIDEA